MQISGAGRERGWGLFPTGWTGEVLRFVIEVWEQLRLPKGAKLEPRITKLLTGAIAARYEREERDWFCVTESPDWNEEGKEISRTDIRLYPPGPKRQKVAFVFESKRLNKPQSNASEYVGDGGMMCFINGKYSVGMPCGAMLGYVMDGNVLRAHTAVCNAIVKKRKPLLMAGDGALRLSPLLVEFKYDGETHHKLPDGTFTIFHLLLPVNWEHESMESTSPG